MFSIPHSDIPAPGIPYDWSVLTVYVNHINNIAWFHMCRDKEKT